MTDIKYLELRCFVSFAYKVGAANTENVQKTTSVSHAVKIRHSIDGDVEVTDIDQLGQLLSSNMYLGCVCLKIKQKRMQHTALSDVKTYSMIRFHLVFRIKI